MSTKPLLASVVLLLMAAILIPQSVATDETKIEPKEESLRLMGATSSQDRGCCVLRTSATKCVFANHGYCQDLAQQQKASFEFHPGVSCREISVCQEGLRITQDTAAGQ